jgi:hypothetical protein
MRITSLALGAGLAIAAGTVRQSTVAKTADASAPRDTTARSGPVRKDTTIRSTGADLVTAFLGKSIDTSGSTKLDVMIVSIPDPISSHLDWSYDAQLESVRRAFERDGYLVDRFWLPWRQPLDSASVSIATADALPGARVPGVILFRKSSGMTPDLRLVYVIGEVPTLGVHKAALREALNERARLLAQMKMPDTVIRIVGPAFSGSSRSMRLAIDGWRDSTHTSTPIRIVTGGASDFGNLAMLSGPGLSFTSTVHTSARLVDAALRLLVDKLEIKKSEVAFLIEGSTQYGAGAQQVKDSTDKQQKGDATDAPLSVSFPLSISSLRAQYARHPEDQSASKTDAAAAKASPRLPLDTREPASLTESPRNLSQLTPSATEIMFLQLERTLLSHRIRAVAILATDIRDQLFLASELRKRLPDLQLVFIGSNSLLLRGEYAEALVGSFVISTYPLFAENQFWDLTKNDNERFAFMSDESEGVFNALLHQLGADSAMAEYITPMMHDSIPRGRRPPVWYTVIGRDAFYPLALDSASSKAAAQDSLYMFSRSAEGKRTETERFPWRSEFFIALTALGLGFVVSVGVLQFRTATRVDAALVSPFGSNVFREISGSPLGGDDSEQRVAEATSLLLHRELYVFLRYVAMFGAFSAAMLLVLRPSAHGIGLSRWALILSGIVVLGLSILVVARVLSQTLEIRHLGRVHNLGFLTAGRSPRRHTLLWNIEKVARVGMLVVGIGYLLLVLLFLAQVLNLDPQESTFFFHRAVALAGGVSSAVPIVLASLGFVTWSSWHLVRIELLSEPTVYEHFLLHSAAAEAWLAEARLRVRSIERDIKHTFNAAAGWAKSAVDAMQVVELVPVAASAAPANQTRAFLMRAEAQAYHVEQLALDAERTVARAIGAVGEPTPAQQKVIEQQTRETERVRQRCRDAMVIARKRCGIPASPEGVLATVQRAESVSARTDVAADTKPERSSTGAFYERRRAPRRPPASGWRRWTRLVMNWVDDRDRDKWLDRRSMSAAQRVRDALLYLIPTFDALGLLVGLGVLGVWLSTHFELTMESLVLTTHGWLFGMSSFDALFRCTVIASIGATTWATYRFVTVWGGIRTVLDDIDPALHPGFVKLPAKLARITRLTPFGETSRHEIEREVDEQWLELNRIEVAADLRLPADVVAPPMPRSRPYEIDVSAQQLFGTLHDKLQECKTKALLSENAPAKDAPVSAEQQWAAKLAALYAVYVADYIDWVFQHLRYLASFMMIAMVLTSILLSSYSFHPQSVFRILTLLIMGVAVLVIVSAVVQINRHPVLSAIMNPATGPSGWNPQMMSNLITYVLVPLITVASTQLPQVREFLFSWVTPLLRAFVKN